MLVHSGSRSLGEEILGAYLETTKGQTCKGSSEETEEIANYLRGHNLALNFAKRNRFLIAHRLLEQIDSRKRPSDFAVEEGDCLIDIYHNFVEKRENQWIHRKGATPSNHSQLLVIPGSRGSHSYMVKVIAENCPNSGYSLAHGAGRKMARSKAFAVVKDQNPNP